MTPHAHLAGLVAVVVLIGLVAGPHLKIEAAWFACLGAMALAATLWSVPYQFASYLAFWSASDGYLFAHDQVRTFSVAYVPLSLGGLLVSIPLWRLLGFLS